jgi:hypothetical protein
MENEEQLIAVINLLKETSQRDFKNLSASNVGSNHITKDEIVQKVCDRSQAALELNHMLHSAIEWILGGKTLRGFYAYKIKDATRKNQCTADQNAKMKNLEILTELIVELD